MNNGKIQFVDLAAQYQRLKLEIDAAMAEVCARGDFILGAQGYGLSSGPTDQRMRLTTINFSHVLWLRDMMVANDDADKPIWIGEMGWNYVPDEATAPDIIGRLNYGQVTEEQAARFAVEAYQRAEREWPFVGVLSYWFFKPADDHEKKDDPRSEVGQQKSVGGTALRVSELIVLVDHS